VISGSGVNARLRGRFIPGDLHRAKPRSREENGAPFVIDDRRLRQIDFEGATFHFEDIGKANMAAARLYVATAGACDPGPHGWGGIDWHRDPTRKVGSG
jgi:hypothetical protein